MNSQSTHTGLIRRYAALSAPIRVRTHARERRAEWSMQARAARAHYNALETRRRAANAMLRRVRTTHNWIKALLIGEAVARLGADDAQLRVLDVCGGRGGDVNKWMHHGAERVVVVDVSERSLDEARRRHAPLVPTRVTTHCADAFADTPLWPSALALEFDVVSCQFALHYAFESRERAHAAVRQLVRYATDDASIIGTVPHARRLYDAASSSSMSAPIVFGDATFRIEADALGQFVAAYGGRYEFTFDGAVDRHTEYVVQRASLDEAFGAVGWHIDTYESFDEYAARRGHDRALRDAMRVPPGDDYARITTLYAVFIATKHTSPRA